MKIRRKKHDILFSDLVRRRDNYTCQNCGAYKGDDMQSCDAAHITPRASVGLRWHPLNAITLCRGCHMFFTKYPLDWADWLREKFGEDRVAELRLVHNQTVKWYDKARRDIYEHMKSEYKKQQPGEDFAQHELMHVFGE
jgi:5-methylcytosine-specific restriction endonuclease McrA